MNYENAGYVYAIRNVVNGGMYIGSTTAYKSRWHAHKSLLRKGRHHSFVLQKAWDKHGEAAFEFVLLLVCPRDQRVEFENRLMPMQRYNIQRTARESLVRGGWRHTESFKQKMSAIHSGKPLSEAHRQKIGLAHAGRVHGEAYREIARKRQLGKKPSLQTKARLSESVKKARVHDVQRTEQAVMSIHKTVLEGASVQEACAAYKISRTAFYNHLRRLGLKTGKQTLGVTNDV